MSRTPGSSRLVQSVTGEVPADRMGVTLCHEHLVCDISGHSGRADNILDDPELMAEELKAFRDAGGGSVVDVTPEGVGRDPVALRRISLLSGVSILSGIALYVESTYPPWVRGASESAIADFLEEHLVGGVSGVRAALIGELASHNENHIDWTRYRLTPGEERVFRAAAAAQRRTGAPICTHASLGRAGHAQLDVLEHAGARLSRVAIGHCDAQCHERLEDDLPYYRGILTRGAFCGFDTIGWTELATDDQRADRVAALVGLGFARRILLGTDTCRRSQLRAKGGRGFGFLFSSFLPRLRERKVTEAQMHEMLVLAPQDFLAGPPDPGERSLPCA